MARSWMDREYRRKRREQGRPHPATECSDAEIAAFDAAATAAEKLGLRGAQRRDHVAAAMRAFHRV